MRLSEGMILASTVIQRDPTKYLAEIDGVTCGCAIGAGLLANGITIEDWQRMGPAIRFEIFPWLWRAIDKDSVKAFTSFGYRPGSDENFDNAISALFRFVCKGELTYDALAEWVATVEPKCGECNNYYCSCVSAEKYELMIRESA